MADKESVSLMHMGVSQQQQMKLGQRLIMSAHMQQALKLLQLPIQELETFIEEQVVLNPCLEIVDAEEKAPSDEENGDVEKKQGDEEAEITISDQDLTILNRLEEDFRDHFSESEPAPVKRTSQEDKLKTFLEQSICAETTLQEHLKHQAHETFETEEEYSIAEILIGYIDEFGFLKTPLAEISLLHHIEENKLQKILAGIQTLEPFGVGASTIQESLLIQLRSLKKEDTLAYQIVKDHYDQLLHNQIPIIQKQIKCSYDDIQEAVDKHIAKLDLHPGTHFSHRDAQVIIPDVTLREENDKLIVDVERDCLSNLRLNSRYLKMLKDPDASQETRHFVKHHLVSARWLVRNIQQRFSNLERIAQSLAEKQYAFFMNPQGQLHPMTMKSMAEELNVHESTIARTVSNKYISSPRGIFPLRDFFTAKYVLDEGEDLSSRTVKEEILEVIKKEDKQHPLSDEKISLRLKEKGIPCARRTVTKYREILQIGNTQQRRKY